MVLPGKMRESSLMKGQSNGGKTLAQMIQMDGLELSKTVLAALTKGMSSPFAANCVSNLTLNKMDPMSLQYGF